MASNRKINILFVIMQMQMGGSERLVLNLASRIDRGIFNPSVAWFFGDTPLKEFQDLGIPLFYVPKTKRIDWNSMRRLEKIIRLNNIQVVNAHHFMSMVYSFYGCKLRRAGLIYTEHAEWEIEEISQRWKTIGSYLVNRINWAVGVTEGVTAKLKQELKAADKNVATILNGVDCEAIVRDAKFDQTIKRSLNLDDHDFVISVVANLKRVKNHLFLLRAFKEVAAIVPNSRLLIIGQGFAKDPGNTEVELRAYTHDHGLENRVLFLGYCGEIPRILGVTDVFCLTSHMEGLPISLVEAMAAGLPVVGTDVPGIRDVITANKNGILVKADDVVSLRNALLSLVQDRNLRQRLGKAGQEKARITYSFERCMKDYEKLFLSAVDHKRSAPEANKYHSSLTEPSSAAKPSKRWPVRIFSLIRS